MAKEFILPEASTLDVELEQLREKIRSGEIAPDEKPDSAQMPASYRDMEAQLIEALQFVDEVNTKIDAMKAKIEAAMAEVGVKKWVSEHMTISRTEAGVSEVFDAKRFKRENPDIAREYTKNVERKASIRLTIR